MNDEIPKFEDKLELVQKRAVKRFKLSNIFSWILDGFSLDHGAFHTLKNLTFRPGEMVKSYLQEGRLDFTPPFRLLLVTTTIVLISFEYSSIQDETIANYKTLNDSNTSEELTKYLGELFQRYANIFLWLIIPFLSLFSWLFNRKSGFNYAENLVLNTFYTVFVNLIFVILLFDPWINSGVLFTIYTLVSILHYMLCLKGMFGISWLKSFWQMLGIFTISIILYGLLIAVTFGALTFYLIETGQIAKN